MTTVSILIGFVYSETPNVEMLECAYADIYHMYTYYSNPSNFSPSTHSIITFSDVTQSPYEMIGHICKDKIDCRIGEYHSNTSQWRTVRSIKDFNKALDSISAEEVNRLLVYYSGHCMEGGKLLFPNEDLLDMVKFREKFTSRFHRAQMVFVIDCCFSDNMCLPYRYDMDSESFKLDNLDNPCKQLVLSIGSSGKDNKSISMRDSSMFTKCFVNILESKTYNLKDSITRLQRWSSDAQENYESTISCSSSYCVTPVLCRWIYDNNYEIYVNNPTISIVIIRSDTNEETQEIERT